MTDAVHSYYRAALAALRYVEARRPSGRRFGENADALWKGFAGELTSRDRVDLLIRDADMEWPGAFGARTVFDRPGVPEDEAFGVGWTALDSVDAEELWREGVRAAQRPDVRAALDSVARAWGIEPLLFELGEVAPSDRLVLVGPSAIAAGIVRFAQDGALGWSEQVVVVATPEAHRQLAALGAAFVNVNKPTELLTAEKAERSAGSKGWKGAQARLCIASDADERDRTAAERRFGGGA